jgi:hypothetical protein
MRKMMRTKISGYLPCSISKDGDIYELKDVELFYRPPRRPLSVRVVMVEPGMKICPADNSENGCNKIAKELENTGFKTRIGYNKDGNLWSIAVLDNED